MIDPQLEQKVREAKYLAPWVRLLERYPQLKTRYSDWQRPPGEWMRFLRLVSEGNRLDQVLDRAREAAMAMRTRDFQPSPPMLDELEGWLEEIMGGINGCPNVNTCIGFLQEHIRLGQPITKNTNPWIRGFYRVMGNPGRLEEEWFAHRVREAYPRVREWVTSGCPEDVSAAELTARESQLEHNKPRSKGCPPEERAKQDALCARWRKENGTDSRRIIPDIDEGRKAARATSQQVNPGVANAILQLVLAGDVTSARELHLEHYGKPLSEHLEEHAQQMARNMANAKREKLSDSTEQS